MEEDERGEMCKALCMLWPSSIYERLMTTGRPASKSLPKVMEEEIRGLPIPRLRR